MSERSWRATLVALAVVHLVQGVWAAADPATFTERLADFGAYNPHLVRDFAAAVTTIGAGLLLAARLRSWRTPVLVLAATWNGLHALSHVVDAGDAHPHAVGPIEAAALVAATAVLAALAVLSAQEGR